MRPDTARTTMAAFSDGRLRLVRPQWFGRGVRPRLLPILIVTATVLLSVKIGLIWHDTGSLLEASGIAISSAQARASEPPQTRHAAAKPASSKPGAAGHDPGKGKEQAAVARPDDGAAAAGRAPPRPEEPAFSAAEIEVLRQLAGRRAALDARARELDKRDALLRAAEQRLDAKMQALMDLQSRVEGLLKRHDGEQDAKMASLAKLYESMKPKDAAAILQTLELDVVLQVAERIKERKLAAIMAEMNTARARDLTMELVRLRAIDAAPASGAMAPKPRGSR